jgi:hypothetical protein
MIALAMWSCCIVSDKLEFMGREIEPREVALKINPL